MDHWILGSAFLLTTLLVARMARKLPVTPLTTGDSYAYQYLFNYRPPFYGWVVNGWQAVTGSVDYLPLMQLVLLGIGVFVFAVELGRMLRSPLVPLLGVPVLLIHPGIHDSPSWMMTEAPFMALVFMGLAMQCRFVRRGGLDALLLAAACFTLATLTRSTGMAFLPLPLLAAVFDRRAALGLGVLRAAACTAVAVVCVLIGMAWTWSRGGPFEIGSWAGISVLGKSLVLARPGELPLLPEPLATQVAEAAGVARQLTAEQPDLAARLRAQIQASSDVRYAVFWPAADTDWPEWVAADGRERDRLAKAISAPLIAAHRGEYLRMVANDWISLIVHPHYWPAAFTSTPADPQRFAACAQTETCWGIDRYDFPLFGLVPLMGVSVFGALAALLLIPLAAWPVLRRRGSPMLVLMWGGAMVVHGTLLATAAAEAGHMRYTVATHAVEMMLLMWLAMLVFRRLTGRGDVA
ncbi:hypothetical protein ACFQS7_24130 [Dankookia sp. GCM10030260]|uniref:hypothetical protein n=1 Tax=Dankookia sp. GCM10030260 TaxID=3273390 RepID=UPI003610AB43